MSPPRSCCLPQVRWLVRMAFLLGVCCAGVLIRTGMAPIHRTFPRCPPIGSCSAAGEATYRLPKEAAPTFPALLRQLQQDGSQLGVAAYGLSETTLEEVFLRVSESAAAPGGTPNGAAAGTSSGEKQRSAGAWGGAAADGAGGSRSEFVVVNLPRSAYVKVS